MLLTSLWDLDGTVVKQVTNDLDHQVLVLLRNLGPWLRTCLASLVVKFGSQPFVRLMEALSDVLCC